MGRTAKMGSVADHGVAPVGPTSWVRVTEIPAKLVGRGKLAAVKGTVRVLPIPCSNNVMMLPGAI